MEARRRGGSFGRCGPATRATAPGSSPSGAAAAVPRPVALANGRYDGSRQAALAIAKRRRNDVNFASGPGDGQAPPQRRQLVTVCPGRHRRYPSKNSAAKSMPDAAIGRTPISSAQHRRCGTRVHSVTRSRTMLSGERHTEAWLRNSEPRPCHSPDCGTCGESMTWSRFCRTRRR